MSVHRAARVGAGGFQALLLLALLASGDAVQAQTQGKSVDGIYTCIDDKGRRLTADRPIAECTAKEQRVLNKDGSLKTIHPPTLTADERAEKEAQERKLATARAAQADAVRRDRNLKARFPNEDAHNRAREAALDSVRLAMRASESRLKDLAAERKPLLNEAEFYVGRQMPLKLRSALDANDAAADAQRAAMTNQEAELARITRLYDLELDRLRRLWGGAMPGSLGEMPTSRADGLQPAAATR